MVRNNNSTRKTVAQKSIPSSDVTKNMDEHAASKEVCFRITPFPHFIFWEGKVTFLKTNHISDGFFRRNQKQISNWIVLFRQSNRSSPTRIIHLSVWMSIYSNIDLHSYKLLFSFYPNGDNDLPSGDSESALDHGPSGANGSHGADGCSSGWSLVGSLGWSAAGWKHWGWCPTCDFPETKLGKFPETKLGNFMWENTQDPGREVEKRGMEWNRIDCEKKQAYYVWIVGCLAWIFWCCRFHDLH